MLTSLKWPTFKTEEQLLDSPCFSRLSRTYYIVIPHHCLLSPTPMSYTHAQHLLKLTQLQTRVDVYKYSFLPQTIIRWNSLQIPDIDTIDLVSNIICDCNAH